MSDARRPMREFPRNRAVLVERVVPDELRRLVASDPEFEQFTVARYFGPGYITIGTGRKIEPSHPDFLGWYELPGATPEEHRA